MGAEQNRDPEAEAKAVALYTDILSWSQFGSPVRAISIGGIYDESEDSSDWGYIFIKDEKLNIDIRVYHSYLSSSQRWYDKFFDPSQLANGYVLIEQRKESEEWTETLLLPHEDSYIALTYDYRSGVFPQSAPNLFDDASLIDLLDRVKKLAHVPWTIDTEFDNYYRFLDALRAGLGKEPRPGVVTDAEGGVVPMCVFGFEDDNLLPRFVKKVSEEERNAKKRRHYQTEYLKLDTDLL